MMKRMLQLSCIMTLGVLLNWSPVRADSVWEDPCTGEKCRSCDDPQPTGQYCYVTDDGCQDYDCAAIRACGPNDLYAQCECLPCNN